MTPVERGPETLAGVLDALEQAVERARAVPMSTSVVVNRTEVAHLVAQARAALPEEMRAADEVLAEADAVRARAQAEAERIVADARARAAELVSAEAVVVAARAQAEEVVAEAEETARHLRREADDWCDRRLADFEIDLGRVVAQVRAGREKLAERLAVDEGAPDGPGGPEDDGGPRR